MVNIYSCTNLHVQEQRNKRHTDVETIDYWSAVFLKTIWPRITHYVGIPLPLM